MKDKQAWHVDLPRIGERLFNRWMMSSEDLIKSLKEMNATRRATETQDADIRNIENRLSQIEIEDLTEFRDGINKLIAIVKRAKQDGSQTPSN